MFLFKHLWWLPNRKGVIAGLFLFAYGLGSLLLNNFHVGFLNPSGAAPDYPPFPFTYPNEKYFTSPELIEKVPNLFFLLFVAYFFMQMGGSFFLAVPPITEQQSSSLPAKQRYPVSVEGLRNILSNRNFWYMYLCFALCTESVCLLTAMWKVIGFSVDLSDKNLTLVGAWSAVSNAVGRLFWGWMHDKFGGANAMMLLCFSLMVFEILCALSLNCLNWLLCVGVVLCFGCIGGLYAVMPAWNASQFGTDSLGFVYGCMFTSQLVTVTISTALTTTLLPKVGHAGMLCVAGLGNAVACLIIQLFLQDCCSLHTPNLNQKSQKRR
eukprot:Filipodium_phascolosomae@DN2377_c0_g1_i1.p1